MTTTRSAGLVLAALACLLALACTGCVASSLATNSGRKPARGTWSVGAEQWVHVGEPVTISYALHSGRADYAILNFEPPGITKVSLESEPGRFYVENMRFAVPTAPDKPVVIKAAAFRQRDDRDHMDMDGQLLSRDSPDDVPDAKVSSASMKLHVYQSTLTIEVPANPDGYRWETARLTLYGEADKTSDVLPERQYRKGFRVTGPSESGTFLIYYEPSAEQVKRSGTTRVVLTVLTASGQEHRQETNLPTP